jgi:hypothetical protein
MTRTARLFVLACVALTGCAHQQVAGVRNPIPFARDESSMERAMAKQLRARGLQVTEAVVEGDDVIVRMSFAATSKAPEFELRIDTQASTKDGSERVVILELRPELHFTEEQRVAVLQVLNAYHVESFAGTFRLMPDGTLIGQWPLNVLQSAGALSMDSIFDTMERLSLGWANVAGLLRACEACSGKTTSAALGRGIPSGGVN